MTVLHLQMLAVAEQAFKAFLDDVQEGFMVMTQHAARRRAAHEQAMQNGGDSNRSVVTRTVRSPPIVFTMAHVEFMTKLGDVLAGLPRGSAGQPLYAIAASIKGSMAVA